MTAEGLQLATEASRAHYISLLVGAVFLFFVMLALGAGIRHLVRSTSFRVLPVTLGVIGALFAYLAYGHVASAVQEALVLRFIDTGFICILPGPLGMFVVPVASSFVALAIIFRRRTPRSAA